LQQMAIAPTWHRTASRLRAVQRQTYDVVLMDADARYGRARSLAQDQCALAATGAAGIIAMTPTLAGHRDMCAGRYG
jgi:hypothetical protein